jgi:hypothetical protein
MLFSERKMNSEMLPLLHLDSIDFSTFSPETRYDFFRVDVTHLSPDFFTVQMLEVEAINSNQTKF